MKQPLRRVVVEAAAKVNVGFRVGARRADGYHDVEGLIQTISLVDHLELVAADDGPLARVVVLGFPDLESDDNLAVLAAHALAERVGGNAVRIVVRKAIPVAAGLGGGSADAAATLLGLNALWGAGLRPADLSQIGATIGSDVPALLRGGLVHVWGRGERVRRVGSFSSGCIVLGITHDGISAADAYAAFDAAPSPASQAFHHNGLEAAALRLDPALNDRLEAMRAAAGVAFVSGSGPTVVGVVATADEADAVVRRLDGVFDEVLIARPVDWGVRMTLGS